MRGVDAVGDQVDRAMFGPQRARDRRTQFVIVLDQQYPHDTPGVGCESVEPPHRPPRRRQMGRFTKRMKEKLTLEHRQWAALGAVVVLAASAGGAGAMAMTRPSIEMAPTVATPIAKLASSSATSPPVRR
ncbi:hypothetical protein WR25_07069 [Diploscapter pachys]|uniref:Uncharacterized protein n=1 Tax=Diploscapter pachys TaxID=2018661 RepID=A0A2A2M587_9BILA|nr:hypothetical protein WR25_07069 [Diploscapter pachys]